MCPCGLWSLLHHPPYIKRNRLQLLQLVSLAVLMFVANSVSASRGTGCWAMLRGPVGDADAQVASSSIVNKKNTAQNPGRMVCGFFFPKEGAFPYSRHIPLLVPHHNHEQAEP